MWNPFRKKKNTGPWANRKSFYGYVYDNINVPTTILVEELLLYTPNINRVIITELVELTKTEIESYR